MVNGKFVCLREQKLIGKELIKRLEIFQMFPVTYRLTV